MYNLAKQLFSASASTTALLQRIFSNFGFVQSKLCNLLKNEKADKLTFILKCFSKNNKK